MSKISVVILTKNEEKVIERCLQSVYGWADEIVVIDDESSDSTPSIAKKYGARLFIKPLNQDFGSQRNFGIEKAQYEWIYFIDADEVLPESLKQEIKESIGKENYSAYNIEIKRCFYGNILNYAVINGDRIRLFRKGCAYYSRKVRETPIVIKGEIGTLKNFFIHYIPESVDRLINKFLYYSEIDSKIFVDASPVSWKRLRYLLTLKSLNFFWVFYIKNKGYKDGAHGLIWCILNIIGLQIRWLKIWERASKEGKFYSYEGGFYGKRKTKKKI